MAEAARISGDIQIERSRDGALVVRLTGAWTLDTGVPPSAEVARALATSPSPTRLAFDFQGLGPWDSGLISFVLRAGELAADRRVPLDEATLPEGLRRLLALARRVPGARPRQVERPSSWLARVGLVALDGWGETRAMLGFLGEATLAFGRLVRGQARFRARDFWLLVQQAGADALPIVTLISFLVGTIFAFVGAVQLERFGATIYVADLVGIAIVREMGAVMTAIVMAGRTGAAYAAQLGTMKVTQEIDALTTMGFSALDFLVLPRMLALCLMMPLLCLYADALGVLGGSLIGIGMLHLPPATYFNQTFNAVALSDLGGGVLKASVYGVLVAIAGCLRGLQSGSSSSAVGDAATSAVVTGIVAIIVACGIFAVVFYILGI
ncbi:MAG: ABC transporter permease [Deltaproteobacteria bacterium]|nr:ABC transporter permease [Deltaproteobacteria bacterium]